MAASIQAWLKPLQKGGGAEEGEIVLPGVDTRDRPPNERIQECAIMLAATAPQTHLRSQDQQAILLVDHDLLTGEGSGAPMNAWARSSTSPRA